MVELRWSSFLAVILVACGGGGTVTDAGGVDAHPTDMTMSGSDLGDHDSGCTTDADGDGHRSIACGGDDCDDTDANRYPGNHEVCDTTNHDEDCDPATFGVRDDDGDGYPDAHCCNVAPSGTMNCGTDCDDTNSHIHPALPEVCNGIDDNCNGMIDEGLDHGLFHDGDGDGFGNPAAPCGMTCMIGSGCVGDNTDCNDTNASVHPGATEICGDGIDQDCNPATLGVMIDCYPDADMDGYRAAGAMPVQMCSCGAGYQPVTAPTGDCCDTDGSAHPGPSPYRTTPRMVCGGYDYDCDGSEMVDPALMLSSMTVFPQFPAISGPTHPYCPDRTLVALPHCLSIVGLMPGACDAGNFLWCIEATPGCTSTRGDATPFTAHCGEAHDVEACPGGLGPSMAGCYYCVPPTASTGTVTIGCR